MDGAAGYLWHVTPKGQSGQAKATILFGTAGPSLSVPEDASSRTVGDKVYIYAQAFTIAPVGADDVTRGQYLMAHEDGSQSEWSNGVSVTIA